MKIKSGSAQSQRFFQDPRLDAAFRRMFVEPDRCCAEALPVPQLTRSTDGAPVKQSPTHTPAFAVFAQLAPEPRRRKPVMDDTEDGTREDESSEPSSAEEECRAARQHRLTTTEVRTSVSIDIERRPVAPGLVIVNRSSETTVSARESTRTRSSTFIERVTRQTVAVEGA